MRIYDVAMLYQDSTLEIEVCQCQGAVSTCFIPRSAPHLHVPSLATSVLGAVFGLLCMWQVFLSHMMSRICFWFPCPVFNCSDLSVNHSAALAAAAVAEEEEEEEEVGEGCRSS